MTTFIEAVRNKETSLDQIDEWVDRWHHGEGGGMPLRDFLGMSKDQYAEWVLNPAALASFVEADDQHPAVTAWSSDGLEK